jgi:hypothetical protein
MTATFAERWRCMELDRGVRHPGKMVACGDKALDLDGIQGMPRELVARMRAEGLEVQAERRRAGRRPGVTDKSQRAEPAFEPTAPHNEAVAELRHFGLTVDQAPPKVSLFMQSYCGSVDGRPSIPRFDPM